MPILTTEQRISLLIQKAKTEQITYDELVDLQHILTRLLEYIDEEVITQYNFREGIANLTNRFEGVS